MKEEDGPTCNQIEKEIQTKREDRKREKEAEREGETRQIEETLEKWCK